MAHTKWEYVRTFETNNDTLVPNSWSVVRIDGRGFHKFSKIHNFERPNDIRGLSLMNFAAKIVMAEFEDIVMAYGQSDEYSFIFRRESEVFDLRGSKILSTLVSKFTSAFVFHWGKFFDDQPLEYPPSFDGRIVQYPTDKNVKDYLCWRQADCHINNLYNTTFWNLVLNGELTNQEAEQRLSGTLSSDKNEILYTQFGINYNNEPEIFRKGTTLVQKPKAQKLSRGDYLKRRKPKKEASNVDQATSLKNLRTLEHDKMMAIKELNCDLIRPEFWDEHGYIINPEAAKANALQHEVQEALTQLLANRPE